MPKYKLSENDEHFNGTIKEICGKTIKQITQKSSKERKPRGGRIINGTKAEYIRWPWQVKKATKSFLTFLFVSKKKYREESKDLNLFY